MINIRCVYGVTSEQRKYGLVFVPAVDIGPILSDLSTMAYAQILTEETGIFIRTLSDDEPDVEPAFLIGPV